MLSLNTAHYICSLATIELPASLYTHSSSYGRAEEENKSISHCFLFDIHLNNLFFFCRCAYCVFVCVSAHFAVQRDCMLTQSAFYSSRPSHLSVSLWHACEKQTQLHAMSRFDRFLAERKTKTSGINDPKYLNVWFRVVRISYCGDDFFFLFDKKDLSL